MRVTYRVLAYLLALGVLVQAAAIAAAWFGVIKDLDGGTMLDQDFKGNLGHVLHGIVGRTVMPAVALPPLIVSFFARVNDGMKWALIVVGLVALQVVLAFAAFGAPLVGALHGINALALLGCAVHAGRRAGVVVAEAVEVPEARTGAGAAT